MANKAERAIIMGGALLGLGLVGTCSDKPAHWAAEAISAGQIPPQPEKVEAKRGPVHIAIGIDETRSDVSEQIPQIVEATSSFIKSPVLSSGDTVNFCAVGGKSEDPARCNAYAMDKNRDDLIQAVESATAVEDGSSYNYTRINDALRLILKDMEAPCAVGVWTDAMEMGKELRPINPGSCDVKVLIPEEKYSAGAKDVCSHVKGDCEVVLAKNGGDLESTFKGMTETLQKKSQAKADALAEKRFAKAMEDWENYKQSILKSTVEVEEKIALAVRSMIAALTALGTSITIYLNRPKCSGYLYIARGKRIPRMIALDAADAQTVQISETGHVTALWKGGMKYGNQSIEGSEAQFLDGGSTYFSPTLLRGQEKIEIYKRLQNSVDNT